MKIAFIADTHLSGNKNSPQFAFFNRAVEQIKKDKVQTLVHLGDMVMHGDERALDLYFNSISFVENSHFILGNHDVNGAPNQEKVLSLAKDVKFSDGKRTFLGIHSHFARISNEEKEKICALNDGDVLFTHYPVTSLAQEDKEFFEEVLSQKALIVIYAHTHKFSKGTMGKSTLINLAAIDPDKCIGTYPCMYYIDFDQEISIEEIEFKQDKSILLDLKEHFGISCVDNYKDLTYAIEKGVKAVELRLNASDWQPDYSLLPLIEEWIKATNGYLSVHMPNLKYKEGQIVGEQTWFNAIEYASKINADGLTIHPPKIKRAELTDELFNKFVEYYSAVVNAVDKRVAIGIENIHKGKNEEIDKTNMYGFGYTPEDVTRLISAINEKAGYERVGFVFDVGHARNNGSLASRYPISSWMEIMGNRTVAYHIHQVVRVDEELKNHRAIEDWFGPMISYASFFYAWDSGLINKKPVFLEVKGAENYEKSVVAFEQILKKA